MDEFLAQGGAEAHGDAAPHLVQAYAQAIGPALDALAAAFVALVDALLALVAAALCEVDAAVADVAALVADVAAAAADAAELAWARISESRNWSAGYGTAVDCWAYACSVSFWPFSSVTRRT